MHDSRNGFRCLALAITACLGMTVMVRAEDAGDKTATLEHLVQAAAHLEKAGQQELAAKVYGIVAVEAEANRQRLAASGRRPIEQTDSSVSRPQTCTATEDQVFVELKLIEFSWAKLRQSGMDLISLRQLLESSGTPAILDEEGRMSQLIELLCNEGLARVLSKPRLVTISGQPATVEIGQDCTTVSPDSPSRMRFECTPQVMPQGRLSLALDFRLQIPTDEESWADDDRNTADPARSLGVQTQVEMRSGDTLILGGMRQAVDSDARSTLMLLTATSGQICDQSRSP